MDEIEKLDKEIEKETKLIEDSLTDESQKEYSRKRRDELNAQKEALLKQNAPKETAPKVEEKSYLEKAMEGSRENGLKYSAAFTSNLGTQTKEGLVEAKDASLKANPNYLEADNKRNEAKMANSNIPGNEAKVDMAENEVQNLMKGAQLNENDKEAYAAQNDIEEAVASTKGEGNPTTPKTVIENLSKKYGMTTNFTPDGKIVPTEQSQWERADKVGKLAMFGTALSCIISALSGGNIPPINFNKIVGVDKQYTTYLANVHQYNEAISSGVKKNAENVASADYGSFMASLPEGERNILENISSDYEYTKAAADKQRVETQGKVQKELIDAQAESAVTMLISLQEARNKGLISQKTFDDFIQLKRGEMGQWSGLWERILDKAGIQTNVKGNKIGIGSVGTGSVGK